MEWIEVVKQYGPWSIGWAVSIYLGLWILSRVDKDIESRTNLAAAVNKMCELTEKIYERLTNGKLP